MTVSPATALLDQNGNQIGLAASPLAVTGTVNLASQVQVSNFPATQNVSGTVSLNIPSTPLPVWIQGTQAVSGSVALTNWPATVGVSGSVALTNWPLTINVSSSAGVAISYATNATGSQFTQPITSVTPTLTASILGNGGTVASSIQILAANNSRRGFSITSDINNTVNWLINLGTTAATGSSGPMALGGTVSTAGKYSFYLAPGDYYEQVPAQYLGAIQACMAPSGSNQFVYVDEYT